MGRFLFYVGILLAGFCIEHGKSSRDVVGHCPRGFEGYDHYYLSSDNNHVNSCDKHCNSNVDCDQGELCCVEKPWDSSYQGYGQDWAPSPNTRCPVCKRADLGCHDEYMDRYMKNREIYTWHETCAICQCVDGDYNCIYICDTPFAIRKWAVPLICAVFVSLIFTLSMCCCFKCYLNHKIRKLQLQLPQPSTVQEEGPVQMYHLVSPVEDKLPLTANEQNTA